MADDDDRTWRLRAKCAGLPPDLFILDRGHQPAQAMAVCNGPTYGEACSVREACKAYADRHGMVGVWGGEYISSRDYGDRNLDQEIEDAIMDIAAVVVQLSDFRPKAVGE